MYNLNAGLGKYSVKEIDPSLCTHFIYSFAVLDDTTLEMKVYDSWVDLDLKGTVVDSEFLEFYNAMFEDLISLVNRLIFSIQN